jgi:hypothetical protein
MTENTELEQHPVAMHWIDGEWVDSAEHGRSINPATGEVIGMFAMGTKKEAATAVDAALVLLIIQNGKRILSYAHVFLMSWQTVLR